MMTLIFLFRDRQGNDRGTQYASAIFVSDEKQKEIDWTQIEGLWKDTITGVKPEYSYKGYI